MKKIKIAFHWQMLFALLLGAFMGWALSGYYDVWWKFVSCVGDLFMRSIKMIVIPLVLLSTALGVASMDDTRSMGRIATKSFLYYIVTAVLAALVGLFVTDLLLPGRDANGPTLDAEDILAQASEFESKGILDTLTGIVPDNIFEALSSGNILSIVFIAILIGYFMTKIQPQRRRVACDLFESFSDIIMQITAFILKFAPFGIFAFVMVIVGKMGSDTGQLKACFFSFAFFVFVVWIALIVMGGMILPLIVGVVARVSPLKHLKQIYSALMVAFSTSSSYSALPLIISDAKEKFGVSNKIAAFTVPMGITFNKVGTIIYECVAVLFVSQAAGMDLSLTQQATLIGTSIIMVLGAPSVPMAGVIVLAILLKAMNLPTEFVGIFMAIDVLCDMPKTLLNAYSVSCSAIVVARAEGENLKI
ncbi:MAG: dicarboxylate/amino acid:cation symporter [Muribaculaceae bacterium]|nr:dicarboxylate/amino acid:cation symporter [Muribaculaceae bacterium]